MNGLYPIIRRKRRPLVFADGHQPDGPPANAEMLKVETLKSEPIESAAIVPLVAAVPESVPVPVPDGPMSKPKKSRDSSTKN